MRLLAFFTLQVIVCLGYECGWIWSHTCICDLKPNFDGLRKNFKEKLFGQHLVEDAIITGLKAHFANQNPQKALVFFLTGAVGSGKNFVAGVIEEHYNSNRDFTKEDYILKIKAQNFLFVDDIPARIRETKKKIENIAKKSCERALIILDEVDKMPPELLEAVSSYMMSENPDIDDSPSPYRKLVFLLLANEAMGSIRQITINNHKSKDLNGRFHSREELKVVDFSEAITNELTLKKTFSNTYFIIHGFMTYVPFLPLEASHVKQCIYSWLDQRNYQQKREFVDMVLNEIEFDKEFGIFSAYGCRPVEEKILTTIERIKGWSKKTKDEL